MKKNKQYLQIGMICAFDKTNTLKQKETEINQVVLIKKVLYRPFGKSIWLVKDIDGDKDSVPFKCPEFVLSPSNIMIIRYHEHMPEFSDIDITVIEGLIRRMEHKGLLLYNANEDYVYEAHLGRLKGIYEKIKYYNGLREI